MVIILENIRIILFFELTKISEKCMLFLVISKLAKNILFRNYLLLPITDTKNRYIFVLRTKPTKFLLEP